jgi:3',5'-cyclic AMP phosphodiesterase CpdA
VTVIAHLSDPHIDLSDVLLDRFRSVIDRLPVVDAILVTGDIADHGLDTEYRAFLGELPGHPRVVVPGNHDERAMFERALGSRNSVLDLDGVRIIGLDSSVPGEDHGLLDGETLDFAREAIATAPGSVVLAMHHHSVPVGHPLLDATALQNSSELAALVTSRVIGLLTGHVHTAVSATFAGVPAIGAPGIASTLRLELPARIATSQPPLPGFVVHTIDGAGLRSRFVGV